MLNNVKVLLGLLIVVAGFAYLAIADKTGSEAIEERFLLADWQGSDDRIAAVTAVTLSQGGEQLAITNKDGHWVLNDGFFVAMDPLFKLLQSLKNAELVEAKTANPGKHAQLELADGDLQVAVVTADGQQQVVHLGKQTTSGLTFVRLGGDDQTYVAKGIERVIFNQDDWRLKTVLDFEPSVVTRAQLQIEGGDEIVVVRNSESNDLELLSIPAGSELKPGVYLDQLAAGLSRLMIDEAMPRNTDEMTLMLTNKYQMVDGMEIEIQVYQQDENYYLTVNAPQYPQYQDWMMKIAEYKFTALNRKLEEFIQAKASADSAEEPAADSAEDSQEPPTDGAAEPAVE